MDDTDREAPTPDPALLESFAAAGARTTITVTDPDTGATTELEVPLADVLQVQTAAASQVTTSKGAARWDPERGWLATPAAVKKAAASQKSTPSKK